MSPEQKDIVRALEDNTREILDLKLAIKNFSLLLGPELKKTDTLRRREEEREAFLKKNQIYIDALERS